MLILSAVLWILVSCYYIIVGVSANECSEDYSLEFVAHGTTSTVLRATRRSYPHEIIAIKVPTQGDATHELRVMRHLEQETRSDGTDLSTRTRKYYFVKLLGECTVNGITSIKMQYLPYILQRVIFPTALTLWLDSSKYLKYGFLLMQVILPSLWRNVLFPTFWTERDYKTEFIAYAYQLIHAVEALQRIGIVHGDLRSANVGLYSEGAIKVFDFSHSYAVQTPPGVITYDPVYSAPEALLFRAISDRSHCDAWSAGVIIYEMFSAKPYIGDWMGKYEECERESSGGAWKIYETCSGRAFYHAHRLNRCTKDDSECASVYRDIEERLMKECKPSAFCLSMIEKRYREQEEFGLKMESLMQDEQKRITIGEASKEDLIDLLAGLLRFDYTQRLQPKNALSHNLFERFNSSNAK